MRRLTLLVLLTLGVLFWTGRTVQAASYKFTSIDVPFIDASNLTAIGNIADNGLLIGIYANTSGALHAFLDDHGAFSLIDAPYADAVTTIPSGINSKGQIVGFYFDSAGVTHPYLDDNGVFSLIVVPFPGANAVFGYGISENGQVINGAYNDSSGRTHAYFDTKGVFTTFDVPYKDATGPFAGAIATGGADPNARGQIVGSYTDSAGVIHGYLDYRGSFTSFDVPFPGATLSGFINGLGVGGVNSINNRGQIVGTWFDTITGSAHGFLDYNGSFTSIDVPFPNTAFTVLLSNNASGQLAGFYNDSSGAEHGYVATPNKK